MNQRFSFRFPPPSLSHFQNHLLILASGGVSGLLFWGSIPRADLWLLAWIFLLPGFLCLGFLPPRQLFMLGLVSGIVGGIGRTYWITQTLQLYGDLSLPLALATNVLLVLYLALYSGLFLFLCARFRFASRFFPWIAASLWVLLEWAQTWIITGFPWELVGYSQYRNLPLLQLVSITGVYGISFLVVLVNATLAQLLVFRLPLSRRLGRASPPAILLIVVLVWGQRQIDALEEETGPELKIGIVQGNIPQDQKWQAGKTAGTTRHYVDLTRQLGADPLDLIIFPETALPFYFTHPRYAEYREMIADLARQLQVPLLVGSLGGSWEEGIYNRAFLLDAQGNIQDFADKVHLVPFGEYLPLPFLFQYLEGLTAASGAFLPGQAHKILQVPGTSEHLGTFICFESVFPQITRTLTRLGASVLVTTTNDAWFGRTAAPYQHFSMAVVRAVETGRPVLRAANTGISGLIAPSGRIQRTTELFETTAFSVRVAPRTATTFYVRHGDLFLVLCALLLTGVLLQRTIQTQHQVTREQQQARRDLDQFASSPQPLSCTVVILHGYNSSTSSWNAFTDPLNRCSTNAATCLRMPDLNVDLPIPTLARSLAASLPGEPVDLIGHSLGGLVALEMARQGAVKTRHILALATPFHGSCWARLARFCRFSFPSLLRDLSPGSPFLDQLARTPAYLVGRLQTFYLSGDPVASRTSVQALGSGHRVYRSSFFCGLIRRHRLPYTDPRLIRDLIAILQDRELPPPPRADHD